jgi:uncharacterized membrane protein YeaQ/YmgE (transglycosylase-associated protein family)
VSSRRRALHRRALGSGPYIGRHADLEACDVGAVDPSPAPANEAVRSDVPFLVSPRCVTAERVLLAAPSEPGTVAKVAGRRPKGLRSWEAVIVLLWILGLLLSGLIVGALGRLVIPGPNPMSIGMTMVVGIGGSLLGGLVGALLLGRPGGLLLAVAGAALIVWLIERGRTEGLQRQG